jgi:hypothetical protein
MGGPPLTVGTHGKIRFDKTSTGYKLPGLRRQRSGDGALQK